MIDYRRTAVALARREAIAAAYVAAFLDALGPSSRAPRRPSASEPFTAVPDWRSAGSQPAGSLAAAAVPIGSPVFTDGELEDLEALAARFDRYGPE